MEKDLLCYNFCGFMNLLPPNNDSREKPSTPAIIRETIRLVFISLSDEKFLNKCLHGKTQNNNEL